MQNKLWKTLSFYVVVEEAFSQVLELGASHAFGEDVSQHLMCGVVL
jgi:hypothetical protein